MTAASTQLANAIDSLKGLFGGAQGGVERLPMFRQLLEEASAACAEDVRALADLPVRISLEAIATGTIGDVAVPERADHALAVLSAPGWGSSLFVCADRDVVFALVELLLGGDGSQPAPAPDRALTKLEVDLAGVLFASLARMLAGAFQPIAATAMTIEALGDAIDFDTVHREPAAALARFRFEAMERSGEMLVAIPQAALAPMRKPLSYVAPKAEPPPDPGWMQHIHKEVTRTHVTLTAILDERPGLLSEVFALKVGQIVELNATAESRVRVECNGERLVWCELGKSNGAYTLRVEDFIDREQEFMDDILAA
jgi:flagellar motor switch protein FliM